MANGIIRFGIGKPVVWGGPHGKITVAGGPAQQQSITGLDFAGNTSFPSQTPNTPVLVWNNSILGGTAPFPVYPATYIWKAYPRPNNDAYGSFWTMLFHAKWQTSSFDQSSDQYYGMHPYCEFGTGDNYWEISSHGADEFAASPLITFNQWYTQVAVVWQAGGTDHLRYYWNWPSTSSVIAVDRTQAAANTDPAIIIGDAPWNLGFEAPNAILRGHQFYDTNLSEANIAAEIASPGSFRTPWYLKMNPTPTDVADESGNNNHPAWYDANRPALWTE